MKSSDIRFWDPNADVTGPQPPMTTGPMDNWTGAQDIERLNAEKGVNTMDRLKMLELLRVARKNLSDPSGWVQGAYFVGADGQILDFDQFEPGKVCGRCAYGALIEACELDGTIEKPEPGPLPSSLGCPNVLKDFIQDNAPALFNGPEGYTGLISFNDKLGRSHAAVLALFDTAIARLEAEGLTDTEAQSDEGF